MEKEPLRLFYSYSHQDKILKDELLKHLKILERERLIEGWHDGAIPPGADWDEEIKAKLNYADIILLLVSVDFIASEYCWNIELARAIERHNVGEAIVIPIILRSVDWRRTPLGKLQALPENAQPVASAPNKDDVFSFITQEVRRRAISILEKREQILVSISQIKKPSATIIETTSNLSRSARPSLKERYQETTNLVVSQLDTHGAIVQAAKICPNKDGWIYLSDLGQALRSLNFDFRATGHLKLSHFLREYSDVVELRIDDSSEIPVTLAKLIVKLPSNKSTVENRISTNKVVSRRASGTPKDALFGWAWLGDLNSTLNQLKNLALQEQWFYGKKPDSETNCYPILFNYLIYTFYRLTQEKEKNC